MATDAQINALTALYVGYFDRAPDPAGLQFWIDQIDNGREFNTIAADFAASPEAEALYPYLTTPGVSSPDNFVTNIYLNLFNRIPDAAGLAFWTGVLADGSVSVADMIEAIINGAVNDAGAGTFDRTVLDNKIEVGLDFATKAGDTPGFTYDADAAAAAVAVIDGVTADPATVDAGKLEVDEFLNPSSETFTLTTAVDAGAAFVGGDIDSTFNAQLGLGIDGLVGVQTLQGPDVLDGGAGFDKLNAELNGTGTTANPTISNIEQYNLTSISNIFGTGELDLSRASGYEELWNRGSRANLDVFNVGEQAIIGMDGVRGGTAYTVEYEAGLVVTDQVVVAQSVGSVALGEATLDIVTSGPIDSLTLNATASRLEVNANVGGTLTVNAAGGNEIDLNGGADNAANLIIAGSGSLILNGGSDFSSLETLVSTGYNEGLTLDVSGSEVLESVLTGAGDDAITAAASNFTAGTEATTVDLGLGNNVLTLNDNPGNNVIDSGELSALDFTLGTVSNVQTLELVGVELGGDASLDLDGVGGLETLVFTGFQNVGGDDLLIDNAPEVLTITTAQEIEMNGGLFTIEGVVDLTMTSTGAPGDDSDIRLDGGVNSETLVTLSIEAADDAELDLEGGTDALTTVNVVALGDDADVDISDLGVLGGDAEFAALTTVNVTAAHDADLNMTGRAGIVAFAGTQATQSFTINVTAGAASGILQTRTSAGNAFFTSGDLAAGFVDTNYSTTTILTPANSALHDNGAASDIAAGLDATLELEATNTGNVVNVTWADVGSVDQLANQFAASGSTTGTLDSVINGGNFVDGLAAIAQVDGEGFEAVETITVNAQDGNANVSLTDVYGAFTLDVTATDNATVTLFNTGVISAFVTAGTDAGDTATVTVGGDTVGNAELVNLSVSGDAAIVTLADDLASFTTLDVSGVVTNLVVDTSAAEFVVTGGQFIDYQIGATSDGIDGTIDVNFIGNLDTREVYNFVGGDVGEVVITNFTEGADPNTGDRLDLSAFANGAGQLVFQEIGGNVVITDLAGGVSDFDGSITVVGTTAADLAFNIIYA